jgi:hypothetical protein
VHAPTGIIIEEKSIYFQILFVNGGPGKQRGGCFRYLLSTKGTFLPSNASRPPPFTPLKSPFLFIATKKSMAYPLLTNKQKIKKERM